VSIAEHPRGTSAAARLARLGFVDPARAERLLADAGVLSDAGVLAEDDVLPALGAAADPDLAVLGLVRLAEAAPDRRELLAAVGIDERLRAALFAVLGASAALGEHLARHPGDWRVLSGEGLAARPTQRELEGFLLATVGADPDRPGDPANRARDAAPATLDALRAAYRRCLLRLAARDLCAEPSLDEVAAELADLAAATLTAALAVAAAELPPAAPPCRLAVIGMGKCGGRELNYVSDVDVVFVAEPPPGGEEAAALRTATQLAAGIMRVCSATTAEGVIWPVDAALRPEGKAGPLVRTLASHVAYYRKWAKTWEFQALLKARPVAGDEALGAAYVQALAPLVWRAAQRPRFVEDVQEMRRRVEAQLPKARAEREMKLGPGGLRDVEFAVQLLQLVHGRSDPAVRSGSTLVALEALAQGGYVGRDDAADLAAAYRFLRTVEHRVQLHRLRRTHLLPTDPGELRRLGRVLGFRTDPIAEFETVRARHVREVRRLHEKLFYRPLLLAVARLPAEQARLTPEAAAARLTALGFADPPGALRHLAALTAGVSRRAAIQRTLLPVMLGWFADAPDPDAGLLAFRQVSDALGTTHWYLRLLRDEGAAAERLARLLATSRFVADLLLRAPEAVATLARDDELVPRPRAALENEMRAAVARRREHAEDAVVGVRSLRRHELLRIAAADLLGLLDVREVGAALTDVAAATLAAALDAATARVEADRGAPLPVRFAIVAMGRLGGHEQGYGSDADVLFVVDHQPDLPESEASALAHAVAGELRRLLALPAPDPPLDVDASLRPEGRQGPLVRTLASYAAYYERWSSIWEAQALLRAEPIAGDAELGERFRALADRVRWPRGGIDAAAVREIRRIKARVEAERLPRGADPATHTKLGRGGLADVEWTVQLLQLRHAHRIPALRTTSTLAALRAAGAADLLAADDAAALEAAWVLASRVRNAIVLSRGRPGDSLPGDVRALAGVARAVGYPPDRSTHLTEDYRRAARRARAVVERVFYG
jgi:glutamate-ammonia-ligase adenylyltransferase